jgi:hypothetical protein
MRLLLVLAIAGCASRLPPPTIATPEPEILPPQIAKWDQIPTSVVNCSNSSLDDSQIKDAYQYLGLDVEVVIENQCACKVVLGEIRFLNYKCFDASNNNHGMTRIVFDDNTIVGVAVGIKTEEPMILAHEVGHTLGWMHSSIPGHLMYPRYAYGNSITVGMENP